MRSLLGWESISCTIAGSQASGITGLRVVVLRHLLRIQDFIRRSMTPAEAPDRGARILSALHA